MSSTPENAGTPGMHEESRREKLRKIIEMGIDPWGGRFDDRSWLGDIRARESEVRYRLESGEEIPLPETTPDEEPIDLDLLLACSDPALTPGATGAGAPDDETPCPGPGGFAAEEEAALGG